MALQNDVRIYGRASLLARIRDLVLDKTIKHGYQPLRAVVALVALHMITPSGFWAAQHQGVHRADGATDVIVPSRTINEERPPTGRVCVPDYPCFYPASLAADTCYRSSVCGRPRADELVGKLLTAAS